MGLLSNNEKGRKNQGISDVIDWLEERGIGTESVNYRLRDWLISRQRYWGAPIPMIYREDGTIEAADNGNMPLLPEDVDFLPTGRSPLTYHEPFLNTTDSEGKPARRETDTMDTFMCSSWYQYRYLSPNYDSAAFDPEEAAYWLPVDVYTGGSEHAVMHLLYTRFFTKAMRDIGLFDDTAAAMQAHGRNVDDIFNEPMLMYRSQGQILGAERKGDVIMASGRMVDNKLYANRVEVIEPDAIPADYDGVVGEIMERTENIVHIDVGGDHLQIVEIEDDADIIIPNIDGVNRVDQLKHHLEIQRMSKSKGNVVNPDELVEQYGADSVRAYLMFAFDWQKGGPWDPQGVQGTIRWVKDVWDMVSSGPPTATGNPDDDKTMLRKAHQTIQRVDDSMERFSFNTAVAALMTLRNDIRAILREGAVSADVWRETMSIMLRLMAPITPFMAEELWTEHLGLAFSIHQQPWPTFDAEIAAEDEVTLVVQVNGKVRDRVQVPADISEDDAKARALAAEGVVRFMDGREPRKVIYIGQRHMVNIVV